MKRAHIIALVVIAIAIAAIISLVNDASTYVNFSTAQLNEGKEFHVVGELSKDKPLEYNPEVNPDEFTFYMKDNEGEERKVILNASKPRDIEKSENIVVIGKIQGKEFIASSLLMKCPSKYVDGELQTMETKIEVNSKL